MNEYKQDLVRALLYLEQANQIIKTNLCDDELEEDECLSVDDFIYAMRIKHGIKDKDGMRENK